MVQLLTSQEQARAAASAQDRSPASQEQAKGCFGLYHHHHSKDENKVRLLSGYTVTHEKGKHQIPKSCIPRSLSF